MKLTQTAFLKPYTKRKTELLKKVGKEANKIKKQAAKLRNNSIFGKTIENSMSKLDVKSVTNRRNYLKRSFTPCFRREYNLIMDK